MLAPFFHSSSWRGYHATPSIAPHVPDKCLVVMNAYQPQSEAEIEMAISQGLVEEDHFTDLKRELTSGARGNRDLAQDMAAFAIDGGRIYVGIDESSRPPTLTPVHPTGLCERVEQVALSRIDEPLHVTCTVIPSVHTLRRGYLIVTVPPSPAAPHMVDGRYMGRGDKTNRILADAEVIRLHERRQRATHQVEFLLRHEMSRDPAEGGERGHIFIVAEPVTGQSKMLHDRLLQQDMQQWMRETLRPEVGSVLCYWQPRIDASQDVSRRGARGWAIHSSAISSGRLVQCNTSGSPLLENLMVDMEVSEDGGIRLFCGQGTLPYHELLLVPEGLVIGLLRQVLRATRTVAMTSSYLGSWDVGIAISKLKGTLSYEILARNRTVIDAWRYSDDDYMATVRVSREHLAADPAGIVRRLYGPLSRGLSSSLDVAESSADGQEPRL
jgi:hypothetical protein